VASIATSRKLRAKWIDVMGDKRKTSVLPSWVFSISEEALTELAECAVKDSMLGIDTGSPGNAIDQVARATLAQLSGEHYATAEEQLADLCKVLYPKTPIADLEADELGLAGLIGRQMELDSATGKARWRTTRGRTPQMTSDTEHEYTTEVESKKEKVVSDLYKLRLPEQAQPLIDLVQNADLASSTLMAIREAADARLTSARDLSDLPKLEAKHEAELHAARRERVFGKAEPTLPGFQAYLDRLANTEALGDLDDVSTLVGTVNYWRQQLGAGFFISHASSSRAKPKLVPCRLKPLTGNRYQVLGLGELKDANLYNEQRFPPLVAKPAS